jgi:two-component system response regulator ArlR
MTKILLIEDNKDISRNIKEYLELEWYSVIQAFDGEVWIEKATKGDFDLILLDLMLPEVDGISIARRVVVKKWTPIIMITARESVWDRLLWFEVGAVDYLVKPFDLRELHARVIVHLQNNSHDPRSLNSDELLVWEIHINLKKHTFTKDWADIHLTQKEFLIMDKLISLKDQVVSRADIIEYLWWGDSLFEGDNKLDVYISNIRSKLWKQIIKTIKWVGYMLGE